MRLDRNNASRRRNGDSQSRNEQESERAGYSLLALVVFLSYKFLSKLQKLKTCISPMLLVDKRHHDECVFRNTRYRGVRVSKI